MIIPVRCFSCGKVRSPIPQLPPVDPVVDSAQVIGDLWERYLKLIDEGTSDGLVEIRAAGTLS